MTLEIPVEAPPLRVDEAGAVRVGKTRVTLDLVIAAYKEGTRPEELVDQLTTLELADVYAVYAFYLRHQAEVDAYLAEGERRAAELRAKRVLKKTASDGLSRHGARPETGLFQRTLRSRRLLTLMRSGSA